MLCYNLLVNIFEVKFSTKDSRGGSGEGVFEEITFESQWDFQKYFYIKVFPDSN